MWVGNYYLLDLDYSDPHIVSLKRTRGICMFAVMHNILR